MDPRANHLLYVLTDSNLPTGGFIASSGLEAYTTHGFLKPALHSSGHSNGHGHSRKSTQEGPSREAPIPKGKESEWIIHFTEAELDNFASTTLPYLVDTWWTVSQALNRPDYIISEQGEQGGGVIESTLETLSALDDHHEASLLSHVSRRASKAQGVALLTLYARAFAQDQSTYPDDDPSGDGAQRTEEDQDRQDRRSRQELARELVARYKSKVRGGRAPGHLAICWGILTAALGLSLKQSLHLHLYLHARSLLSAAVRLNLIGPYESTSLLAYPFERLIERTLSRYAPVPDGQDGGKGTGTGRGTGTGLTDWRDLEIRKRGKSQRHGRPGQNRENAEGMEKETEIDRGMDVDHDDDGGAESVDDDLETGFWDWADRPETCGDKGPGTTWPLGEILVSRHDLQHTRLFNS